MDAHLLITTPGRPDRRPTKHKEHSMKRGHVMGNKRERKPATPWWKEQEEAQIQKVEREWAEKETKQGK